MTAPARGQPWHRWRVAAAALLAITVALSAAWRWSRGSPAAATLPDPCTLLSRERAAEVLRAPVDDGRNSSTTASFWPPIPVVDGMVYCVYNSPAFATRLAWGVTSAGVSSRYARAQFELAKKRTPGQQSVPGIGERAFWTPIAKCLVVLAPRQLLGVCVLAEHLKPRRPAEKERAVFVAQEVLKRM